MSRPSRSPPCSCRTLVSTFDFGFQQFLVLLGVLHVRYIFAVLSRALVRRIAISLMVLGSPAAFAASGTVIESFGSTSLVQVGNNFYFYPVGGSSGPQFKYRGTPVAAGQYEWSYIGAEQT